MLKNLIEFKAIIFTCVFFLVLLVFRREFNKLLDWIVSFRKVAGAKGDYKVSAESESPGSTLESKIKEKGDGSAEEMPEMVEDKKLAEENDWLFFVAEKDYDKAIEILEKDLSSEHDDKERSRITAFIGNCKFEKDNKEGAEYFEEALEKTNDNSFIYYWYALSYYWINEYDPAINIIKKGMVSNPTTAFLYNLFADCLVKQSKKIDAVEMLFERLKQDPKIPTHYEKIAAILSGMGKKELARDCCRLGFKHCPDDTSLLDYYGSIVSEMEDYKEAMFVYRRLTIKKPEEATVWTLLGNQYLQLSFNDLALEAYKKGNELAKGSEEWIISNIGNIMKNRGFYTEGASYFKQGLSMESDSQYAHERLAQALKEAKDEVGKRDTLEKEVLQVVRDNGSPEDIIREAQNESSQDESVDG